MKINLMTKFPLASLEKITWNGKRQKVSKNFCQFQTFFNEIIYYYFFAAINNNTVDILTEWREELADEQNINALLKLSKDLLNSEGGQPLGPDELSYRQEQALYWLCKVKS